MYCSHGYKHLKNEKSKDQNNSKAKKNHLFANSNSRNRNKSQSSQALGRSIKKDSYSDRKSQRGQCFNTSATNIDATTVKKDKKQADIDLSQLKCYSYQKNGHHAHQCLDKKPKN